jgi:hypothetical protein
VAIVGALGLYFVIGGVAWATFIYNGVPVPDSFTTILATIAGGWLGCWRRAGGPPDPRNRGGMRRRRRTKGVDGIDQRP